MEISIDFIVKLKKEILVSRYAVAKVGNAISLGLYYRIGQNLEKELTKGQWGTGVLAEIANRLQQELPGLRGFSASNLKKMRIYYNAWKDGQDIGSLLTNQMKKEEIEIGSSLTNQLQGAGKDVDEKSKTQAFLSISFTHHFEILTKTNAEKDRWYYIAEAAKQFWTVRQLRNELQNQSHLVQQNTANNFQAALPSTLSNRAIRAFKDQYLLDFVNVEDADDEMDERVLEKEIVNNIKKFLMALGTDFSFMGNQFRLVVDIDEYFIDLLFFHRGLQALVAFELKKGAFKPEYMGKMNFYLSALDDLVRQPHENPSIGIVLCKEKNQKKVEYSFRDLSKPLGVATYKTTDTLPPELQKALPDAETLKKLID